LPFKGKDNLEPFTGTDFLAISKTFDSLQFRVEKFLYENRKSSAAFEEISEYHQKLYFIFRECVLQYYDPLNLLVNLSSFNQLYPLSSKPGLSFYSLSLQTENRKKQISSFIYLSALLCASLVIIDDQYISGNFLNISKKLILEAMDQKWMEFTERISLSRDTIGLQAYAQKDPLIQYGRLCTKEFSELIAETQSLIINSLINSIEINKIYLGI
ncbi:MAG: hypothetical protein MUF43_14275, partial [Flavobacterium sp.]|nr:hypothetical protein [Flavobacterium sp.]